MFNLWINVDAKRHPIYSVSTLLDDKGKAVGASGWIESVEGKEVKIRLKDKRNKKTKDDIVAGLWIDGDW